MFLENLGGYKYRPFAFSIASVNRWNLTATADLNGDGWLDVIVGAMDLGSVARLQRNIPGQAAEAGTDPVSVLVFENRMNAKSR